MHRIEAYQSDGLRGAQGRPDLPSVLAKAGAETKQIASSLLCLTDNHRKWELWPVLPVSA